MRLAKRCASLDKIYMNKINIFFLVLVIISASCNSVEKKNILRINKNFEKGWKLEYQSREESSNLRDVWSMSDYFIDNQTSEILYLEEVRYLDEMQYLDNIFNPSAENNPSKIIKIKPGINYQLPIIRGMGDIYILRNPPEKTNTFKDEKEISKWHLHY